jgi:hypothetical protein
MKDAIIPHKRVMDSKRWSRLRLLKLRTTPFCEACGAVGRLTPATVVHHIKAVNDGGDPYPGLDGLQPLCKHCHDTVTRFEQLGQPRGLRVAMTEACRLTRIISGIGNSPDKNETGGGAFKNPTTDPANERGGVGTFFNMRSMCFCKAS